MPCTEYMSLQEQSTSRKNTITQRTNKLHGAEPFLRRRHFCSYLRTSQQFMKPDSSLRCSQEPSTGPYHEPNRSSPCHPILRSTFILLSHLSLGLPSGLFSSGFPTNILFVLPHPCYMSCPSYPHWLVRLNYIWQRVKVMKLLIMQLSAISHSRHGCLYCLRLFCLCCSAWRQSLCDGLILRPRTPTDRV
jgi:hypothetical protein